MRNRNYRTVELPPPTSLFENQRSADDRNTVNSEQKDIYTGNPTSVINASINDIIKNLEKERETISNDVNFIKSLDKTEQIVVHKSGEKGDKGEKGDVGLPGKRGAKSSWSCERKYIENDETVLYWIPFDGTDYTEVKILCNVELSYNCLFYLYCDNVLLASVAVPKNGEKIVRLLSSALPSSLCMLEVRAKLFIVDEETIDDCENTINTKSYANSIEFIMN
jgi:hypothetical protein